MAYSRASIPLFTLFVLAIAACLLYLILAKNLFQLENLKRPILSQNFFQTSDQQPANTLKALDDSQAASETSVLNKLAFGKSKKATTSPQENSAAQKHEDVQLPESDKARDGVQDVAVNSSVPIAGFVVSEQASSKEHMLQHKKLWDKYSVRVPKLYSQPANENAQTVLSRVGEISMNLEMLFEQDRGRWMIRAAEAKKELIQIAVSGEREGARAISFSGVDNATDALAWAMIANAVSPKDYFLTVCANRLSLCTEDVFAAASEQAKRDVVSYGFIVKLH